MNKLSWLLYLGDVLPNLGEAIAIITIFLVLTLSAVNVTYFQDGKKPKFSTKHFMLVLLLLIPAVLIPSKETIFLIAGSEAGEMALKSEVTQELLTDIHTAIKHQLKTLSE